MIPQIEARRHSPGMLWLLGALAASVYCWAAWPIGALVDRIRDHRA